MGSLDQVNPRGFRLLINDPKPKELTRDRSDSKFSEVGFGLYTLVMVENKVNVSQVCRSCEHRMAPLYFLTLYS